MSTDRDLSVEWEPETAAPKPSTDPAIHIYSDLDGRLNAVADRRYFADHETTDVGVDPAAGVLVFDPSGDRRPLTISRDDNRHGGDVATAARLRRFVDEDDVDETLVVPLEKRGDLLVADVADALDKRFDRSGTDAEPSASADTAETAETAETDETAEQSETDASDDDSGESPEGYYTDRPAVEDAVAERLQAGEREVTAAAIAAADDVDLNESWVGRALTTLDDSDAPIDVERLETDPGEPTTYRLTPTGDLAERLGDADTSGDSDAAVPDAKSSHSEATIRDCAEAVDTVQDLAEMLDLSVGEARFEARRADVYGQLRDDVAPMGSGGVTTDD